MKSRLSASLRKSTSWAIALCVVLPMMAVVGCSGGSKVGKVTGKVTYQGKPVTGGSLVFAPVPAQGDSAPGAPATVTIDADGSYKTTSGAVVGQCKVLYTAPSGLPEGYVAKPSVAPPKSPFLDLVPKQKEVEVKAGDNTIDIELVKP